AMLAEQGQYVVEPAPGAVRMGVVERPGAVYEPEDRLAVDLALQAVALVQRGHEAADMVDEPLLALPVVMDVNLHVGNPLAAQFGERVEQLGGVLLLGVEEGVAG